MTTQMPERIILDGKPQFLYADPLDQLLIKRRIRITAPDGLTSACHRQYIGTWDLEYGMLRLAGLCTYGVEELPLAETMQKRVLRLLRTDRFPVPATWFNGPLRIPIGPMLVRGFHGWSHWFTRERVITCRAGVVVRDREVDTLAMLELALERRKGLREYLDPDNTPGGPLAWLTDEDYDHLRGDWWPPSSRPGPLNPPGDAA